MSKELSEARMNPPAYTHGIVQGLWIVGLCFAALLFGLYVQALQPMESASTAQSSPSYVTLATSDPELSLYAERCKGLAEIGPRYWDYDTLKGLFVKFKCFDEAISFSIERWRAAKLAGIAQSAHEAYCRGLQSIEFQPRDAAKFEAVRSKTGC